LREERRKMAEPESRRKAEAAAAKAKAEADKISALLNQPAPSSRRRHGDSALGSDGQIDYSTCPDVKAPPGMKAVITVRDNMWNVALEPDRA
jgi:hypothetical protein